MQQIIINFSSFPEGKKTILPRKLPPTKLNKKAINKILNTKIASKKLSPAMIEIISSAKTKAPAKKGNPMIKITPRTFRNIIFIES